MDVRAQIATVFHLDKCIGCHTCSLACKNLWTSRKGTEYMWWNNVETKPGTGYPTLWEDQRQYQGGWEIHGNRLNPVIGGRNKILANIFFNPFLPSMDDYYEPWTYRYEQLFNAPPENDQPVARAVSEVTGDLMDIEAGPNWDDDLSGSPVYARNDINLNVLDDAEKKAIFEMERAIFFYTPRICNHCLNPACLAVCPSGAIRKRGKDGIVLINQERCRGWRFCVSGCPYKKSYYNWESGKSEKCILCFPRLEEGQAPACFHSCVGRIRYIGILFYDADRIREVAGANARSLVSQQRSLILPPFDPVVVAAAKKNGIADDWIKAAQNSPIYKLVKRWKIALPLHPEFRTLPMLFYIPPLSPLAATIENGFYNLAKPELFTDAHDGRIPMKYMANIFAAGETEPVENALQKLWMVRMFQREQSVGDVGYNRITANLDRIELKAEELREIYELIALPRFKDRFVMPPYHHESDIEVIEDPMQLKFETGFGFSRLPRRGP